MRAEKIKQIETIKQLSPFFSTALESRTFKVAILFFILGLVFFIKRKYFTDSTAVVKEGLVECNKRFEELKQKFNDDSQYFKSSRLALFKEELDQIKNTLSSRKNLFTWAETNRLKKIISTFQSNIDDHREQINENFFQKEKIRCKDIFCTEDGTYLLTDEQIKAVLSDDDRNLIVAGAGSGKTRVIDFKVRYLINYKKVNPRKIILLSFSRRSAIDLANKISENAIGVEAKTIHAFSLKIIGKHNKQFFDETKKELDFFVIKALGETLKEKAAFRLFNAFYEKFFSSVKPLIFYNSLNELRADLKKSNAKILPGDRFEEFKTTQNLTTLKGDLVRSIDERYIADFLFLQNINYEYEKKYPYSQESYYPDFYLVDYNIYLEHFALTSDKNTVPTWFEKPQQYIDGMNWKRDLHDHNNTKMIESYSYLLNAGDTSNYLTKLLNEHGVSTSIANDDEKVLGQITKQFNKFFLKFYNAFKMSGFSIQELTGKFHTPMNAIFLQLFGKFIEKFEYLVKAESKIDFNDLIILAKDKYQNQSVKEYDYIIVDEFQDTSNLAMGLLNEVYNFNPNATLFSVGDDWQSIYGFNGSDVTILSLYEESYKNVAVRKLNRNYRSHERIVDLGKRFISKNPMQISKDVVSKNENYKHCDIAFISYEQMEKKIQSIPDSESIFVLYRYNSDCSVEKGLFAEYFRLGKNRKPVKDPSCKKDISLMTIHASKGLEARHVFILFPDGMNRKFPSEIEDHPVFDMLKNNSDTFSFSEERRLMYVAITRAEQNLYFVCPKGIKDPNSLFWDELREMI